MVWFGRRKIVVLTSRVGRRLGLAASSLWLCVMLLAVACKAESLTASPVAAILQSTERTPTPDACGMPSPTPAGEHLLWSADHETGDLSQWYQNQTGAVYTTGTGTVRITRAVAHSGCYALELSIRDADGQTQAARIFRWRENLKEGYYSAWFYFPQRYEPKLYRNIFQFKSETGDRNDPIWVLNVGNRPTGEMYFYLFDWLHRKGYEQTALDVPTKRWINIEVFYRRSMRKAGRITVWQDGVLLFDLDGVQTAIGDNTLWSIDNYSDEISPSDATIYVDDAAISTTRIMIHER